MKRLALALLLLAGSAQAATYYVTPVSTFTWAEGTNPVTPTTLTVANANATAGDIIRLLPGNYSATNQDIAPVNSGTSGNRITFMGHVLDTTSVTVRNLSLDQKSYITVKWVRSTGGASVQAAAGGGGGGAPLSDSLTNCRIQGGLNFYGSYDLAVNECVIGKGGTAGIQIAANSGAVPSAPTMRPAFTNLRVYVGGESGANAGNNCFKLAQVRNAAFSGVKVSSYASGSSGGVVPFEINFSKDCSFTDCKWTLNNQTPTDNLYAFMLRDSTRFCSFLRCSVTVDPASIHTTNITWAASGAVPTVAGTYANTFTNCFWETTGEARLQNSAYRYNFTGNVFKLGGTGFHVVTQSDTMTFDHNTFVRSSVGSVFISDDGLNRMPAITFKNNIVIASAGIGSPACAVGLVSILPPTSGSSYVNNNLYWSATPADSLKLVNFSGCATASKATWCSTYSRDCNSRFGNPNLNASTFIPNTGSPALGAYWPDGYVGAYNPTIAGDTTPPGQINDLSGAALSATRTSLAWTAAGDDGFSGVASTTVVKRAAAQIVTETDWTNATTISTTTSTNSTGGEQQSATDNTVSASTTYWYAVRSTDDASNQGAIGNSISITTPAAGDVTAPSAIGDLAASAMGGDGRAVYLTWTAPGNDAGVGTASSYDVRYRAAGTFIEANWAGATQVTGEPTPAAAGSFQYLVVGGLANATQYTFAVKTTDATGNTSTISNAATVTTNAATPPIATTATRKKKLSRAVF